MADKLPDVIRHISLEEIELHMKRIWERIGDELERAFTLHDLQSQPHQQKWHFNPTQPRDSRGHWTGGGAIPAHIDPGTPALAAALLPQPAPSAAVLNRLTVLGPQARQQMRFSLCHYMVRYARWLQQGGTKPLLPSSVLHAYGGGVALPPGTGGLSPGGLSPAGGHDSPVGAGLHGPAGYGSPWSPPGHGGAAHTNHGAGQGLIPAWAPWSSAADKTAALGRILAVMNAPGQATNAELTAALQATLFPP